MTQLSWAGDTGTTFLVMSTGQDTGDWPLGGAGWEGQGQSGDLGIVYVKRMFLW